MCTFGLSGCCVKPHCHTRLLQRRGSHTTRELQMHSSMPQHFITRKIPRENPHREVQNLSDDKRETKAGGFWAPTLRAPTLQAPSPSGVPQTAGRHPSGKQPFGDSAFSGPRGFRDSGFGGSADTLRGFTLRGKQRASGVQLSKQRPPGVQLHANNNCKGSAQQTAIKKFKQSANQRRGGLKEKSKQAAQKIQAISKQRQRSAQQTAARGFKHLANLNFGQSRFSSAQSILAQRGFSSAHSGQSSAWHTVGFGGSALHTYGNGGSAQLAQ